MPLTRPAGRNTPLFSAEELHALMSAHHAVVLRGRPLSVGLAPLILLAPRALRNTTVGIRSVLSKGPESLVQKCRQGLGAYAGGYFEGVDPGRETMRLDRAQGHPLTLRAQHSGKYT